MKDRIARSVFWIVWSRGGIQVLSFLSTLLVARLLNPSDYGLMALAGIWTGTIAMLAELGLGAAIIQFRDLEDRDLNSCFWLTMGVASGGYIALYVAAPAIAVWFARPMLSDVLRVVGLTLPLTAIRIVPDSLLRKRLALDKVSKAEIVSVVVTIPVVLGMAWAGARVWALVAGALIAPLTQSLVAFWFVRWWPGMQVGGTRFREILYYSGATLGSNTCWALREQMDTVILGKVAGDAVLGIFSMAKQLAMLPVSKVSGIVTQIAPAAYAELQDNRIVLCSFFLRNLRLVTSVCFPLCVGTILFADDLIQVMLTPKWLPSVPVLRILSIYALSASVVMLFPPVLMARYRAGLLFQYMLLQLILMPIVFWIGAIWAGAVGVAAGWAVVYPIVAIWLGKQTLAEMNLNWRTFFTHMRPAVFATAGMAVALAVFHAGWLHRNNDWVVMRLVATVLFGVAVYGTILMLISAQIRSELKEVLSWLFQRRNILEDVQ